MAAPLSLTCPKGTNTDVGANRDGAFKLKWSGPATAVYRVVERHGSEVRTVFQGRALATTLTGRSGGKYRYTVGIVHAGHVTRRSDPCVVRVRPYSLTMAFSFFFVGSLVTLATILLVLSGHRAHKKGEIG